MDNDQLVAFILGVVGLTCSITAIVLTLTGAG